MFEFKFKFEFKYEFKGTWYLRNKKILLISGFYILRKIAKSPNNYMHRVRFFLVAQAKIKIGSKTPFTQFFYILIIWKDIGFTWKIIFGIFTISLRFETPWVRKNGFYQNDTMLKLKKSQYLNSIFQLNFTKYEKKLW